MTLQVFPNENCGVPEVAVSSEPSHSDTVMKKPTYILSVQRGFSLVELLVVIAVIAIIAAIAIPNIANITGAASQSSARRNAQNLASVFASAQAAGYSNAASSVVAIAGLLTNGVSVTNGGQVMTFRVDGLSPAQITAATPFLTPGANSLIYNPGTN